MTRDEAKAAVHKVLWKNGIDPDNISRLEMNECIQEVMDNINSPTVAKIKWLPLRLLTWIKIKLYNGAAWLFRLATPR